MTSHEHPPRASAASIRRERVRGAAPDTLAM